MKHVQITDEQWDLEIKPQTGLFNLHLHDVWAYRDLLLLLVRRDFVAFYKQTILGPLWFFIQPIFTTVIYTFVFGSLAGISADGLPHPLFYTAGITAWNYFSDCLTKTSTVFKDNSAMFGKVYFPRLIMPLSLVASNLIRFGVQMLLFLLMIAYWALFKGFFGMNLYVLLFPLLLLLMGCLGLGLGMIITAMTTKYRDLTFLVTFGVALLMYGTTIIYPLSVAVAKYPKYAWIIKYNPLTPILETFRYGFLGKGSFSWESLGYCTAATFVITLLGIIVFNRVEKNFVDTV
jgi:lipopolysaccharide transport system permease protein